MFRWNSYETNLLSTFEGLLDSEALSDVTLFCEGQSSQCSVMNMLRYIGQQINMCVCSTAINNCWKQK